MFHFRVYVEKIDLNVHKLYITSIEEGDGGVYSCRAVINNEARWKNLTLVVFSEYEQVQFLLPVVKSNQTVNDRVAHSDI